MRFNLLILLMIFPVPALANPSFTVGSNPYETIFAYPHDLLKWPERAAFLSWNPQTLPWQGDVTDISNRPSESYTMNYQEVEFAPPSDYDGDPNDLQSWMRVSSYAYKNRLAAGGLTTTRFGKFLIELTNTSTDMELTADGVARTQDSGAAEGDYNLVPFTGETKAARDEYTVDIAFARPVLGSPLGIRLKYAKKTADVPNGHTKFTRDGTTYNLPRLTWGWATTGCNHIFGYSSTNVDAFYQDSYTVYDGRRTDLQLSFERNGNYKTGIRYRTSREDGENYSWVYDEGSAFNGSYHVDEYWKDRRSARLLRGYSKVRFLRIRDADVGVLFFLQRATSADTRVNQMVGSETDSREGKGEYVIETNPFLNYKFRGGYLDVGILMELAWTRMRNTSVRWNSASRSDQEDVLWSTSPYLGWSPSWENFSRGSEWFFATGFEVGSSIGVYKRLSLISRLTVLRKFTRMTKIYGQSDIPEGGNAYEFNQTHERYNYKAESWMTGAFGISYGRGPIETFVIMQMPLGYLIRQRTELRDTSEVLFDHEKRNMWQVQQPTTMRVLMVWGF